MEEKDILNTEELSEDINKEVIDEVTDDTIEVIEDEGTDDTTEVIEDEGTDEVTSNITEIIEDEVTENTENDEFSDFKSDNSQQEFLDVIDTGKRKKGVVYTSLIIASIILVISVVLFAGYKLLLTPTITGSWVYIEDLNASKEDGSALPYLVFDKDGIASYEIGSLSYYGPYSVSTTGGVSTLTASIPYALSGEFGITLSGNNFTGKTLSISSDTAAVEFVSIKREAISIAIPDNFTVVDELVGTWTNTEQGLTYYINDDGTMTFNITSDGVGMDIKGTYYAEDGTINFVYLTDENVEMPIAYTINESGNLVIEEVEFVNTRTTTK